ncbi:MAG: hypothetical protein V3T58_02520 [Candidatus Hydrothermarchaeales archaeon]
MKIENSKNPDTIKRHIRPSHRTILNILKWEEGPALENVANKFFLDQYWISSFWHYLDIRELFILNPPIEKELTSSFSEVMYVGGFPFDVTIFYVCSSYSELKSKNRMIVDYPLYGGNISYKKGMSEKKVNSVFKDVRKKFDAYIKNSKKKIDVFWGYPSEVFQEPNIFVFNNGGRIIYATDCIKGKLDTHSICFDYWDILTTPVNERDLRETLSFVGWDYSKNKRIKQKAKLKDITFIFWSQKKRRKIGIRNTIEKITNGSKGTLCNKFRNAL